MCNSIAWAFDTVCPAIWVEKSQEYLEKVFSKNWQDEYVVWDCAAGTGNLLAGLVNKYNLWASTIDQPDVDTMHALIDDGFNLLPDHVFQFDFLNDKFDKLPKGLKDIIDDPEKRKKLIIYINPPYAEADNRRGEGRRGVASSAIQGNYSMTMGYTKREMYVNFLVRVYFEIPGCKLGEFSKMKGICSPRFIDFRQFFKAKLLKCFIVPANTFDNVAGQFAIGFKIWDLSKKENINNVTADIFNKNDVLIGCKKYSPYSNMPLINDWVKIFRKSLSESIATIIGVGSDFQNQRLVRIDKPYMKVPADNHHWQITKENLMESCVYLTVRHIFPSTWINERDQFLYPNDSYNKSPGFKYDCLVMTLFHAQNHVSIADGVNHWIPFTEQEVNAKTNFQSNFMSDFLKGKTFSPEAQEVINSGRELWRYYHSKIVNNRTDSVDASFYDIREFFQGRSEKGTMKQKSDNDHYNALIKTLRQNMSVLAEKIKTKVYEYGFLVE